MAGNRNVKKYKLQKYKFFIIKDRVKQSKLIFYIRNIEMKKIKNIQNEDFEIDLTDIKQTNHLFLELLYNLSKYPHSKIPKRLVREGLFIFERLNVMRNNKVKK